MFVILKMQTLNYFQYTNTLDMYYNNIIFKNIVFLELYLLVKWSVKHDFFFF